jgi:heat shock protein HslJ
VEHTIRPTCDVGGRAVFAIVSVSCASDEGSGDGGAQDPASLKGKSWVVTEIVDQDGDTQVVDIGIDATFDGSAITGDASCNSYSATYDATETSMSVSDVTSTRAVCPAEEQQIVDRYLELLGGAASYTVDGDSMSVRDGDGTPTIEFG